MLVKACRTLLKSLREQTTQTAQTAIHRLRLQSLRGQITRTVQTVQTAIRRLRLKSLKAQTAQTVLQRAKPDKPGCRVSLGTSRKGCRVSLGTSRKECRASREVSREECPAIPPSRQNTPRLISWKKTVKVPAMKVLRAVRVQYL